MSTFTSEPGTRLGGRYRLEDRLAAAGGWSAWKAIDEILARPVSVIIFASGFPWLEQVVTAARAASRLTDTRLTQVFDVEDSWENAYIVLEWPVGDTLADLIATGAMEPLAGARIVADVASALSVAHAAGLAHLCLRPEAVRWTPGGGVKVTGLGIDAALSGISVDDPALADTHGLGQLLYAALTGLWPGDDYAGLPPAPLADGLPRRPRQVRAGVPTVLDEVASRALALPGRDAAAPFTKPAEVAAALTDAIPPVQIPPAVAPAERHRPDGYRHGPQRPPHGGQSRGGQYGGSQNRGGQYGGSQNRGSQYGGSQYGGSQPRGYADEDADQPAERRSPGRLAVLTLIVLVAVVGASAAALHILHKPAPAAASGSKSSHSHGQSTAAAAAVTPISASGFDALNPAGDPGDENSYLAENVLHNNPAGWNTQWYGSPEFGGLKTGTGLIFNLGKQVRVASVQVKFGATPGADVEILMGDSAARTPANVRSMTEVASANDVSGTVTFTVTHSPADQYLVIWFTKLPPMAKSHGRFMAQVFSVSIRGAS
jgi:serine/threonine protein kinase